MAKSTTKRHSRKSSKPTKPYEGFPLFPHATGRWAKKIRQKLHYFGKVADDPKGAAALEQFNREWPYLKDGRTPPPVDTGDFCSLALLCNAFLTTKKNQMDAGELPRTSFRDYYGSTDLLIAHFGKDRRVDDLCPADFEALRESMAKRLGPVSLRNRINRIRVVMKYAGDNDLIDRPVKYGQSFNRPAKKVIRKARNEAGPRLFTREELLTMLSALAGQPVVVEGEEEAATVPANPALRAMVLLGLNCGFPLPARASRGCTKSTCFNRWSSATSR